MQDLPVDNTARGVKVTVENEVLFERFLGGSAAGFAQRMPDRQCQAARRGPDGLDQPLLNGVIDELLHRAPRQFEPLR